MAFNLDNFTLGELTTAINQFPVQWGRVGQMGLFRDTGVRTRTVTVEEQSGALVVLPMHEWGGEGTVAGNINRRAVPFAIRQTVHEDSIDAGDLQDVRAFGTDTANTAAAEIARRLQRMRAKHDITLEWKRMGALRGTVANPDGTQTTNLFTAFNIAQVSVDFLLGTATTDIQSRCAAVFNQIQDNLKGDSMTGVRALVSPEFYGRLITHARVTDAYRATANAAERLGGDMRRGFEFGGIVFEEYRASVGGARLIAASEGHAFPEGTNDTFATYYAPADFLEVANTVGLPFYAKTWERDGGRGMVLHTQCNSLPLCHQPAVLVRLHTSN